MRLQAWLWAWQRLSAVALVLLLAFHMAVMHFVDPTARIDFAGVSLRMQWAAYFVVDWLLLILALFHGLNGARGVILDYWPRAGRTVTLALGLAGLAAVVYGGIALAAFRG